MCKGFKKLLMEIGVLPYVFDEPLEFDCIWCQSPLEISCLDQVFPQEVWGEGDEDHFSIELEWVAKCHVCDEMTLIPKEFYPAIDALRLDAEE